MRIVTVIIVISMFAFLQTSQAADNEAVIKRAVEKWEELKAAYQHVELNCILEASEDPEQRWYSAKRANDSFSILSKGESETESRMHCLNSKYGFVLRGDSPSGQKNPPDVWSITDAGKDLSEKLKTIHMATIGDLIDGPFKLPFCPELQEMLTSESCSVAECKEQADGTVEIGFDFLASEDLTKQMFPLAKMSDFRVRGNVTVDPSLCWAVQHYDFELSTTSNPGGLVRYVGDLAYESGDVNGRSYPYPEQHVIHRTLNGGKTTRTLKTESWRPVKFPESDFTLTAFGLPEIVDPESSTGRWISPYIIFLIIGFVLVLIAGAVLFKK